MAKHSHTGISTKKPGLAGKGRFSPLGLGLVALGVAGAAFLISKKAGAAQGPALVPTPSSQPPTPSVPVNPTQAPAGTPSTNLIPGQTATVVVTDLNFRAGPSTSTTILGQFQPGDALLVLDSSRADGWVQVQSGGGTVGFVCNTCGLSGLTASHPAMRPGSPQVVASNAPGGTPGDTTPSPDGSSSGPSNLSDALSSLLQV